ncbi:MAG: nuclear transport factor 2 family protein [Myxococcota bacterium]
MGNSATEICNLLYTYGRLVDAGDFAGVGRHFAHARITNDRSDEVAEGEGEIAAMYRRTTRLYPETGTPRTQHAFNNPILEVDEDAGRATCHANFVVFQQTDRLPLQPIIAGRYRDRFERVEGAWRYSEKHMIVDLMGDLGDHLLIDL